VTHLARQAAVRRSTRVLRAHRLLGADQVNSVPWQHPEAGVLDANAAGPGESGLARATQKSRKPATRWPTLKNPTETRVGPALREFGSRILRFLTGSAHVILSLPPNLCPGIQPAPVLSPTGGW